MTRKTQENFEQLLWRAGFVTNCGGDLLLDRHRATHYLDCSKRTLDRWIRDNNPCPRALRLLNLHPRLIPESWKGFYFDRMERLWWSGLKNGFEAMDIRMLGEYYRQAHDNGREAQQLAQLVDELRDPVGHKQVQQSLLSLANQINALARDAIFTKLDKSPALNRLGLS